MMMDALLLFLEGTLYSTTVWSISLGLRVLVLFMLIWKKFHEWWEYWEEVDSWFLYSACLGGLHVLYWPADAVLLPTFLEKGAELLTIPRLAWKADNWLVYLLNIQEILPVLLLLVVVLAYLLTAAIRLYHTINFLDNVKNWFSWRENGYFARQEREETFWRLRYLVLTVLLASSWDRSFLPFLPFLLAVPLVVQLVDWFGSASSFVAKDFFPVLFAVFFTVTCFLLLWFGLRVLNGIKDLLDITRWSELKRLIAVHQVHAATGPVEQGISLTRSPFSHVEAREGSESPSTTVEGVCNREQEMLEKKTSSVKDPVLENHGTSGSLDQESGIDYSLLLEQRIKEVEAAIKAKADRKNAREGEIKGEEPAASSQDQVCFQEVAKVNSNRSVSIPPSIRKHLGITSKVEAYLWRNKEKRKLYLSMEEPDDTIAHKVRIQQTGIFFIPKTLMRELSIVSKSKIVFIASNQGITVTIDIISKQRTTSRYYIEGTVVVSSERSLIIPKSIRQRLGISVNNSGYLWKDDESRSLKFSLKKPTIIIPKSVSITKKGYIYIPKDWARMMMIIPGSRAIVSTEKGSIVTIKNEKLALGISNNIQTTDKQVEKTPLTKKGHLPMVNNGKKRMAKNGKKIPCLAQNEFLPENLDINLDVLRTRLTALTTTTGSDHIKEQDLVAAIIYLLSKSKDFEEKNPVTEMKVLEELLKDGKEITKIRGRIDAIFYDTSQKLTELIEAKKIYPGLVRLDISTELRKRSHPFFNNKESILKDICRTMLVQFVNAVGHFYGIGVSIENEKLIIDIIVLEFYKSSKEINESKIKELPELITLLNETDNRIIRSKINRNLSEAIIWLTDKDASKVMKKVKLLWDVFNTN
jgi:bifunctional DNA-binding transcriptional regulator/antitoxin component of YhaV-PrlF toxin-antitoxin module